MENGQLTKCPDSRKLRKAKSVDRRKIQETRKMSQSDITSETILKSSKKVKHADDEGCRMAHGNDERGERRRLYQSVVVDMCCCHDVKSIVS